MSSSVTFGTIKRVVAILIAIAIVLAAGIVVFQAPALFGVEDDPEASIEFEDQNDDGESVTIDEVHLSDGGFVVIRDGAGETLAVSEYLGADTHDNVTVERGEDDGELIGQLTATVHQDTTGNESYTYDETDGEEDRPYLSDGFPVSDTATVTSGDDDPLSDSFVVESISAPSNATTNETIDVVTEVRNPTDLETQQNVEVRLAGTVLERQAVDLEGGETREISFEIDTSGSPPGEQPIGVYAQGYGELTTIDLEFHTEPGVDAVAAGEENVTVDVAIPAQGFVALEDENGDVVGVSEDLEPGEHDGVSVEFADGADPADDEELTAVLYEGTSDDPEVASPLEDEETGDRIETTFTLEDLADDGEGDDAEDDEDGDDNSTDENGGDGGDE